jgi:hypothetical protein
MLGPVGTNSECTPPLTSQKAVSMTVTAEDTVLNFFHACEPLYGIPLTVSCFEARNDEPSFHPRWQCCARIRRLHVNITTKIVTKCPSSSVSVPQWAFGEPMSIYVTFSTVRLRNCTMFIPHWRCLYTAHFHGCNSETSSGRTMKLDIKHKSAGKPNWMSAV